MARPSTLCEVEQRLAVPEVRGVCSRIGFVGEGTFAEVGVMAPNADLAGAITPGAQGVPELLGRRAFWKFDDFIITLANRDEASQSRVLYTAAALDRLRRRTPVIYNAMVESRSFPAASPLGTWRNRYRNTVISFDRTPKFVAAQTVVMDVSPRERDGVEWFENVALVSIDEELIMGRDPDRGSGPIYKRPNPDENYRLYMIDGLVYSIGHEFLHTYLDRRNSVSELAFKVRANRGTTAAENSEEVLVTHTTLRHIGSAVSPAVRADAQARVDEILQLPDAVAMLRDLCTLAANESAPSLRYSCPALN